MATAEVKDEQKVYVYLPWFCDEGKHILSWALSYFPKDKTKIVATSIHNIPTLALNHPQYNVFLNKWRDTCNKFLDKYVAQCEIQKFKAEKLIHSYCQNQESLGLAIAEAILELIDLRAIKNLVMWSAPNSIDDSVAEKANPTCKIWFIDFKGNLLFTRCPKSNLTEATSEEQIRREKQHQQEIEKIQKRENDKNDFLKREIKQLKLENQLQRNGRYQVFKKIKLQRNEWVKQKQQLREIISDLEIGYNKLKQERDNAIKEAQQLRRQKEHSFGNSDMVLGSQFSLRELEQATQNFSDSLKIGEGGFGCVYKGSLEQVTQNFSDSLTIGEGGFGCVDKGSLEQVTQNFSDSLKIGEGGFGCVYEGSLRKTIAGTSNSHFICPIMQEIMKNPCIAADGFTYEAEAIKTWLNRGHTTSPMTNLVLPHRDLIPNHVLRSAIQDWLQQHPQSN